MSADNMICVQRRPDGLWYIWDQSASGDLDWGHGQRLIGQASSRREALSVAHDAEQQSYYEYGVCELDVEDHGVSDHARFVQAAGDALVLLQEIRGYLGHMDPASLARARENWAEVDRHLAQAKQLLEAL
jgi:hypothetical protein